MVTLEMDTDCSSITFSRGRAVLEKHFLETDELPAKVAVIVLSLNGSKVIQPCLESLIMSDYGNLEIIVVDNGSTDNTADLVQQNFPQVRLISTGKNLGFAGGNNVGIKATDADIVILLNDDTTVEPNMVSEIARFAASDPDVGVIGCKILYPDGQTIQHAGAAVLPNGLTRHYGYGERDEGQYDRIFDVAYVTGAAIAIKREVLDKLGLLDAGYYPIYFEEVEYCERARRAGFRVVYLPSAKLLHFESQVTVKASYGFFLRYHLGRLRFVLKNFTLRRMCRFVREEVRWVRKYGWREQGKPLLLAYLKTLLKLPSVFWARRRDWVKQRTNPRIVKSAVDFSSSAFYNSLDGFSGIQDWSGVRIRAVQDKASFDLLKTNGSDKLALAIGAYNGHPVKLRVYTDGKFLGEAPVCDYIHTLRFDLPPIETKKTPSRSQLLRVTLKPEFTDRCTDAGVYRLAVKGAWLE